MAGGQHFIGMSEYMLSVLLLDVASGVTTLKRRMRRIHCWVSQHLPAMSGVCGGVRLGHGYRGE